MALLDLLGTRNLFDITQPAVLSKMLTALVVLIGAFVALGILRSVHQHKKVKPQEKRIGKQLHADIAGILEKIYLSEFRHGQSMEKSYPQESEICIRNRPTITGLSYTIKPNHPKQIIEGRVGKILVFRDAVWDDKDRARIAAQLAAWWFILYDKTKNNEKIPGLAQMKSEREQLLKEAGLGYLAELKSFGRFDVVDLFRKQARTVKKETVMAAAVDKDARKLLELEEKDEFAFGKAEKVHKLGKARIRYALDLLRHGKIELKLLKDDIRIRKELGEDAADETFEELVQDILRLEVLLTWLQTNINVDRQSKEQQAQLREKLVFLERILHDVREKLPHLDMILQQGHKLKPISEAMFH